MKLLKNIFLIFCLLIISLFLISCGKNLSYQNLERIQQLQNIYFDYPVRGEPIGKTADSQLYWDCCSDNDFCDSYNGAFHSGEDWNLKGSRNDIDEGRPVYSIGEGKVIYAKEEEVGFRVVIEHTGTCVIPSKNNIKGSSIGYEQEIVDKIYSVYLHLKDLHVKVGDEVGIDDVIGKIKKYDPEVPPHLHFEIRKEWNNVYESYFENIQQIIDLGFRDPSEFIEANMIKNKVIISSPQAVEEESFSIEINIDEVGEEKKESTNQKYGNSVGNIVNGGLAAIQGEWIFYANASDGWKLYKIKINGTEKSIVTDDKVNNINIVGDWIFYRNSEFNYQNLFNGKMYKVKTDGTEKTRISDDNVDALNVVDDWIYYRNDTDGGKIYKIKKDGSGKVKLTDDSLLDLNSEFEYYSKNLNVVNNYIYYENVSEKSKLYRMNLDGTGRTKICDNSIVSLNVIDNLIYYIYIDDGYSFYKIGIDGNNNTKISNESSWMNFNFYNDYIFYCDNKEFKLSKTNGSQKTILDNTALFPEGIGIENVMVYINIVNDYVYYMSNLELFKVKIDGTDKQIIN